jgi:ketosteroid isomerase-like protein
MKTMLRALPVLAMALLAGASGLGAQETPEQVVERYYASFLTGDYAGGAALMHPEALEQLKTTMAGMAAMPGAVEDPEFKEMFGVATVAEFQALPAATVFERVLRAQLDAPDMREILSNAQVTVLGHVMEGDTTAHVVYRMRMTLGEGMQMDQVQVAPVKRADGEWRVLLTGSLAGMMSGMGAAPTPD